MLANAHRHRRRRFGRLDVRRGLRARAVAGALPRDADRVRRDRHGGRGRSHAAGAARLQRVAGIDEAQFMRETQGTFKLGIEFRNWDWPGEHYVHPFGSFGQLWGGVEFQHHWMRARQRGLNPAPLEEYSCAVRACRPQCLRFSGPAIPALHVLRLRLPLRCRAVRRISCGAGRRARGVKRIEGQVVDVALNARNRRHHRAHAQVRPEDRR